MGCLSHHFIRHQQALFTWFPKLFLLPLVKFRLTSRRVDAALGGNGRWLLTNTWKLKIGYYYYYCLGFQALFLHSEHIFLHSCSIKFETAKRGHVCYTLIC